MLLAAARLLDTGMKAQLKVTLGPFRRKLYLSAFAPQSHLGTPLLDCLGFRSMGVQLLRLCMRLIAHGGNNGSVSVFYLVSGARSCGGS